MVQVILLSEAQFWCASTLCVFLESTTLEFAVPVIWRCRPNWISFRSLYRFLKEIQLGLHLQIIGTANSKVVVLTARKRKKWRHIRTVPLKAKVPALCVDASTTIRTNVLKWRANWAGWKSRGWHKLSLHWLCCSAILAIALPLVLRSNHGKRHTLSFFLPFLLHLE